MNDYEAVGLAEGFIEAESQEQPYYKKHIPEVYEYFLNKSGL